MANLSIKNELAIVRRIDEIRDKTQNLREMCNLIAKESAKLLEAEAAYFYLANDETEELELVSTQYRQSEDLNKFISFITKDNSFRKKEIYSDLGFISVPMLPNKKFIGVFVVKVSKKPTQRFLKMLSAIIMQSDSAIEHSKLFHKIEQKNKELTTIYTIDKLRDEHLDFDDMLNAVMDAITKVIPADTSFVMLYRSDDKKFDLKLPSQYDNSVFDKEDIDSLMSLATKSIEVRVLITEEKISKNIHSAMCIPIIFEDMIIGVLGVINSLKGKFDNDDKRILFAVGSQVDTAIFEDLERKKIKTIFKRYVSKDVVEQMLQHSDKDFLRGERKVLTVLFSDLRGFTSMSEKMDPVELVEILNEHLAAMTDVVLANKGTLDKFIGDAVMAIFGAPIYYEDHAFKAVKTALEMQSAHEKLLEKWAKEGRNVPKLGIGVNTGEMVVGNIGCEKATSYTVIGDNVNLSARLEGLAPGGAIWISESTYQQVKDKIEVEKLPDIKVKGKEKPVSVYRVIRLLSE